MEMSRNELNARRITAISGFVIVVLALVSTIAPLVLPHPDVTASKTEIARYLVDQRTSLLVGSYILGLGWGATLLVFTSGLRVILGRAEGEFGILSMLGFAGGVSVATLLLVIGALSATAALQLPFDDSAGARVLYQVFFFLSTLSAFPTIVNALGFASIMIKTGAIGRWIGWVGILTALAHLAGSFAFAPNTLMSPSGVIASIAPVFYVVWVLCISVSLLRRKRL